ncbi:hypothetical protein [uncultured Microscilla sp.]|uniref:hypothetical protein n=1 Tax=uncultured Microscilla sp. TaxID=432653 RepID=UPI0026304F9E|nr:hypothetical protein [uncultured Microscilla sp.]
MGIENILMQGFSSFKQGIGIFDSGYPTIKLFFSVNHANIYLENSKELLDKNDSKFQESQEISEKMFEQIVRLCADTSKEQKILRCFINEEQRFLNMIISD